MGTYYDEIIEEIRNLMNSGKLQEAGFTARKELNMPYVPPETEEQLKALMREIRYLEAENSGEHTVSIESVLNRLKGKPKSQLSAAAELGSLNLRTITRELQDWLAKDPYPEAAALAIDTIAEQEIPDEFVMVRDGVEYTFWGDSVTPAAKSEGFRCADHYLKEWLSNDHPDLYEMARTLLVHEIYMFLPLSYEKEEGKELALEMIEQVSDMMDDGQTYREVLAMSGNNSLNTGKN